MDDNERSARGYRARAQQLREEAERSTHPETKQTLRDIAATYDQLAETVERIRSN